MKDDLLNLIATYAAVAEAVNWLLFAAALLIHCALAWAVIAATRLAADHIRDSFTRANQTIADIQPRKEKP